MDNDPIEIIRKFKLRTSENFHLIDDMDSWDVEENIRNHVKAVMDAYEIEGELTDIIVVGSRCRGIERENSDLDILVCYKGKEREDDFYNLLNENAVYINQVKVDFNPHNFEDDSALAEYLTEMEKYLKEKADALKGHANRLKAISEAMAIAKKKAMEKKKREEIAKKNLEKEKKKNPRKKVNIKELIEKKKAEIAKRDAERKGEDVG